MPIAQRARLFVVSALVAACLWALPTAVAAQRVAATVYGQPGPPNAVVVHNFGTGQTEVNRVGTGGGLFTSDGRFALLNRQPGSSGVFHELYDVATRTLVPVPVTYTGTIAHPRELAVFGRGQGGVTRLDLTGPRLFPACGNDLVAGLDLSVDGALIVVLCTTDPFVSTPVTRVETLDSATGQRMDSMDLGAGRVASMVSNHDASRLMFVRGISANAFEVSLVDMMQHQVTSVFVDSPFPTGVAAGSCGVAGVTAARDIAAVQCQWTNFTSETARTELVRFDTAQRRVLNAAAGGAPLFFSPDGATAVVNGLGLIDVAADVVVARFPVIANVTAVAFPPIAPTQLNATLSGRTVTLTWTLPPHSPLATGYVLRVGTAPGLTDIATMGLGPATVLSVPNVPPGRYFARLQATNYTGTGVASSDVEIVVP